MSERLEDEIDRLYAAPLDQFVSERNTLSRTLKQAGAGDAASEVSGLRKPTVAAWTVNQLARTHRRDVDLLLDAGKRIVDAQQASISQGGRAGIDAARVTLRKAVTDLTASAQGILGERAGQSTLTRVAETLRSAATEQNGRELLARGRLTSELSDTGWDTIAALTPGDVRERATPPRTKQPQAPGTKRREAPGAKHREAQAGVKAARATVRQEQSALSAARAHLHKATREETRLGKQLETAAAAAEKAKSDLAAIEQRLEQARRQLRELTDG